MRHCLLATAMMTALCAAWAQEDSATTPTELMPLAEHSLLLDVTSTGVRKVAVGERGHILLSDDGVTWTQSAAVPTRSTLTSVTARNGRLWAAGHEGVILSSRDGGDTWELQEADPAQRPDADPNPYLDIFFVDLNLGFAIGAYGQMAITDDGGESWRVEYIADLVNLEDEAEEEFVDEESGEEGAESLEDFKYDADFSDFDDELYYDFHLNGMTMLDDGTLVIAAESGSAYWSDDSGESWNYVELPYPGSMFGILHLENDGLIAFGLRGNVLESGDGGLTWEETDTGVENSLLGGTVTSSGEIVLVGANGQILIREAGAQEFSSYRHPDGEDLANVFAFEDGFIVVGETGVGPYQPRP